MLTDQFKALLSEDGRRRLEEELWNDVERCAREVKLIRLEYRLGIGAFKKAAVKS